MTTIIAKALIFLSASLWVFASDKSLIPKREGSCVISACQRWGAQESFAARL